MRIPARPEVMRSTPAEPEEAPAQPGGSADSARATADRTAQALLDHIEAHLHALLQAAEDEGAPHARHGDAHLAGSAERWHAPTLAWAEAAAAAARGELVAAMSRIRHAEQLEHEARAGARALLAEPATLSDAPWRHRVPGVFASPRAVPVAIDTLVDAILSQRDGHTRAIGSAHELHRRRIVDEPEAEDDDGLAG